MNLTIKDTAFTLKFSIILDKTLNKVIKEEGEQSTGKMGGGLAKVFPSLIEMEVETLARVIEEANKLQTKDKQFKANFDEILQAIDDRMNEDGDAVAIFKEVFEAIDDSAFSRNELKKFAENMKLVKYLKSDELDDEKAEMMIQRLNQGYQEITGSLLVTFEAEA